MNEFIRQRLWNQDWHFLLNGKYDVTNDQVIQGDWSFLDLPHDWSIYFDFDHDSPAQNEGGQLNGGEAWYRKVFYLKPEEVGREISVKFDGVYMNASLYLNGHYLGTYPNGYTPFTYSLTPYLHEDGQANVLAVHVENRQPSSRWYSGSGIYRDVHFLVTDPVHIPLYGTQIQTPVDPEAYEGALVRSQVSTQVKNMSEETREVQVTYQVLDPQDQEVVTFKATPQTLAPGSQGQVQVDFDLEDPALWQVNQVPANLYTLVSQVQVDGQILDQTREIFGYRYYTWTPDQGFFFNGQALKFHGVCLHHDHGALGAVENRAAEARRLRQMQAMGVNAIRTSHNPASEQTLALAAELGLLVQEEAFDTWYAGKKTYDYGRFFDQEATHPSARLGDTWSDLDLRTMVQRGQNNPAIIMWSIGNEIGEADGDERSLETVQRLSRVVKEVDPSRYVTMGTDKFRFGDGTGDHLKVAEHLDIVGLNYAEDNYQRIRDLYPDWLIYGSETSSAVRTRGSYFRPDQLFYHDNRDLRHYEQSDYGNDRVAWGKTATESWTFDRDTPGYAGQFIWTGTDYIGEPTPWHNQNETPPKSSYFGIVDTAGLPKDDYYLYQSQWTQEPMIHLLPHWNWGDADLRDQVSVDGKIPVRVYSNLPQVELFLEGRSLGIKHFVQKEGPQGHTYQEGASPDELYLEWLVDYEPGVLEAVGYDESGRQYKARQETAGPAAGIRLTSERDHLDSDGSDLTYVTFEVVDAQGVRLPNANHEIHFDLQGAGRIIGVDNGQQASRERYQAQADGSWRRRAFNGQGTLLVQSREDVQGLVHVTAQAEGLDSGDLTLNVGDPVDPVASPSSLVFSLDTEAPLEANTWVNYTLWQVDAQGIKSPLGPQDYQVEIIEGEDLLEFKGETLWLYQAGKARLELRSQDLVTCMDLEIGAPVERAQSSKIRYIEKVYQELGPDDPVDLPKTLSVYYESGLPVSYPVTWEDSDQVDSHQGSQSIPGQVQVQDQVLPVTAQIQRITLVAAEDLSLAYPKQEDISLPETVRAYDSRGRLSYQVVEWERPEISAQEVQAYTISGHLLQAPAIQVTAHLRVSDQTVPGENISDQWTGSQLPIAFASYTEEGRSASELNDRMISFDGKPMNYWSNQGSSADEDWVGVVFGDSGEITKRYVSNLSVGYYFGARSIQIDYYCPQAPPVLPEDVSQVRQEEDHPFNDPKNWLPVTGLQEPDEYVDGQMLEWTFDKVETYALRVTLVNDRDQALGITEIQSFAEEVPRSSQADYHFLVNGQSWDPVAQGEHIYSLTESLEYLEIQSQDPVTMTVLPLTLPSSRTQVIVRAEDDSLLGIYELLPNSED